MQEIVKYMTEEFVRFMNQTKEERKRMKKLHAMNTLTNRWFGLVPLSVKIWSKK